MKNQFRWVCVLNSEIVGVLSSRRVSHAKRKYPALRAYGAKTPERLRTVLAMFGQRPTKEVE